jgi:RNA polymerase sigma factor, sigma-70 family
MQRHVKTGKKNRTSYIYYDENGNKLMELFPGENGVTEADIERLHAMDDAEVDEHRRYDYHVTEHLDATRNKEGEDITDHNKRLADNRTNPEAVLIAQEDDAAYAETLFRLTEAMSGLQPQQRELFEKVYIHRRSYTSIAAEEGVTEAAIRNRLKKVHEKLKKILR